MGINLAGQGVLKLFCDRNEAAINHELRIIFNCCNNLF